MQQIPLADDSVEVILCNHLLEHVADDRKALRELHRILRPGGWGILLSPVEKDYEKTYEDDSITDPDERTRIFGQYDHRRIYGADYTDRLREAGFDAVEIDYAARSPTTNAAASPCPRTLSTWSTNTEHGGTHITFR